MELLEYFKSDLQPVRGFEGKHVFVVRVNDSDDFEAWFCSLIFEDKVDSHPAFIGRSHNSSELVRMIVAQSDRDAMLIRLQF